MLHVLLRILKQNARNMFVFSKLFKKYRLQKYVENGQEVSKSNAVSEGCVMASGPGSRDSSSSPPLCGPWCTWRASERLWKKLTHTQSSRKRRRSSSFGGAFSVSVFLGSDLLYSKYSPLLRDGYQKDERNISYALCQACRPFYGEDLLLELSKTTKIHPPKPPKMPTNSLSSTLTAKNLCFRFSISNKMHLSDSLNELQQFDKHEFE